MPVSPVELFSNHGVDPTMSQGNLSRRGFVQRSLGALTFGAGLPTWYAREVVAAQELAMVGAARRIAANDRLVVGSIGVGGQGTGIMKSIAHQPGVEVVAVCDVDRGHRDKAAEEIGNGCAKYHDFRELLDHKGIDVVTIGTPDHWHALVA